MKTYSSATTNSEKFKNLFFSLIIGAVFFLIFTAVGNVIIGLVAFIVVYAISYLLRLIRQNNLNIIKESSVKLLKGKTIIHGDSADLYVGGAMKRGYLALTKDKLYFLIYDSKKNESTVELELCYSDILSHKLHFVIFLEGPDHKIYEIRTSSYAKSYDIICEKCK